ncbi:MAG: hypothetical protein JSW34_09770 [Candidatus Zixiibacteriota bacterium]|nr:MAG: hypothetical protein JSW34_09770 [candidate division Zixibacteria bacterium]
MDTTLGRVKAELAEPAADRIESLVTLINKNINPPTAVSRADVHIRAMYVVSDEVNSFGGRFPPEELASLVELLVDSPVLVGHRKDKLPVARTFHAEIVKRNGRDWVKSYFYWLRSADHAEDLKENIDGGIYKECSIGFTYQLPECSVCGGDIRTCRHQPFETYSAHGRRQRCHFNYRRIERVLETSLVYRGAIPDTMVSKDLKVTDQAANPTEWRPDKIADPMQLPPGQRYLIVPHYDSLEVLVDCREGRMALFDMRGHAVGERLTADLDASALPEMNRAFGVLVAYRGKERCPVASLVKFLSGKAGPVTRIELKLTAQNNSDGDAVDFSEKKLRVRAMRYALTDVAGLEEAAARLMTKCGVRVWAEDGPPPAHAGYVYCPENGSDTFAGRWGIYQSTHKSSAVMSICHDGNVICYDISQFSLLRLTKGGRFLARRLEGGRAPSGLLRHVASGRVTSLIAKEEGLLLQTTGGLSGSYVIQPIRINRCDKFLIYRVGDEFVPIESGESEQ